MRADNHSEEISMGLSELDPQSFIIKIWLEETVEEARKPTWRGHITHVPSGKRKYLQKLGQIMKFVVPYLKTMGVKFGPYWRLRDQLDL